MPAVPPEWITFAPKVIVQSPPQEAWRIWLPVGVAMLSAAIAATGAWLSWRSQMFGFAKDIAAIKRDHRNRQANATLLAFENSVARPVGMALDLIERLALELGRLRPVAEGAHSTALVEFGTGLIAEHSQGLRLCREADSALPSGRAKVFELAFGDTRLDDLFLDAGKDALLQVRPAGLSTFDAVIEAIVRTKVSLRRLLEAERSEQAATCLGAGPDLSELELERWLPRRLRSARHRKRQP